MLKAEHLDQFADELAGHFSVAAVLDALHAFVHPTVNVFAAFRLAIYRGETERFVERKNVFFHSTVRPTFRDEFWPLARKHGMSPMALLAFQRRELLTWSEGMRILEFARRRVLAVRSGAQAQDARRCLLPERSLDGCVLDAACSARAP